MNIKVYTVLIKMELHSLFGGNMFVRLPQDWTDVSTIREIPDNQEVFVHAKTDQSITIDILEYVNEPDDQAVMTHLQEVANSNGCSESEITSLQAVSLDSIQLNQCKSVYLLSSRQVVSKFNEDAKNQVNVHLGLFRLPEYSTDIIVTFNDPTEINSSSSSHVPVLVSAQPWTLEDFLLVFANKSSLWTIIMSKHQLLKPILGESELLRNNRNILRCLEPSKMFDHNTDMNYTQNVIYYERQSIGYVLASGTPYSVFVQHILSSLMYAAAGALFYKRSFNKSMFPTLGTLLCLGFFAERFAQINALFTVVCLMVMMTRVIAISGSVLASKRYALFVVVLFLAFLDARCEMTESWIPYWIRIYPTAIAQFIRRPVWLKSKLQSLRSKLGPLYLFYVSCTAMQSGQAPVFLRCLALFAMTAANIAGFIFRPDNKNIIDQFYPETTLAWRRYYHGRLMLLSLVAITMFVCLQHA